MANIMRHTHKNFSKDLVVSMANRRTLQVDMSKYQKINVFSKQQANFGTVISTASNRVYI